MNYFRRFEAIFLTLITGVAAYAIWRIGDYGRAILDAHYARVHVQDHPLATEHVRVLAQGHLVKKELLKELSGLGAGDQVRIAVYRWTDTELAHACIQSAHAGADIQIITDLQAPQVTGSCLSSLARAGINIWLFTPVGDSSTDRLPLMHHKFITIHRAAQDLYLAGTGSYNFTRSAAHKNCENLLLLNDHALYDAFQAEWHRVKQLTKKWPGVGPNISR